MAIGINLRDEDADLPQEGIGISSSMREPSEPGLVELPWRCFHCDETFHTREAAADHFGLGNYEVEVPMCVEAATTEQAALIRTNREMWERLQKVESELEQAEFQLGNAEYRLRQTKYERFEDIEGRMLAAEAALNAAPPWLARLLRWKAERDWRKGREDMERLTAEVRALEAEKVT